MGDVFRPTLTLVCSWSDFLESNSPPTQKLTAIWQSERYYEYYYLLRLFEPYISEHIFDCKHEVVMNDVILFDAFIYANDPAYYAAFKGKNAFLVQLGDEFLELGIDRYTNFRGVFRTIWSSVFNPAHVMVLPLGFSALNESPPILPASERRYAWSFIGEGGKCSRPESIRALLPIEPHICFSSSAIDGLTFFGQSATGKKRISETGFVDILNDSAFAPAPMGNATIDSCRVYDALEAGAIPIVESRLTLDYFHELFGNHPLPTVRSWSQARGLVKRLINDPVRLNQLQKSCVEWWKNYQLELTAKIGVFLSERSAASDEVVALRSKLPGLPGWQYFELLRHQSPRGLLRRMKRQLSRLVTHGMWRESMRK